MLIDEHEAVMFFESQRWGDVAVCPRCGSTEFYPMIGRDGNRNKDYRWRCKDCKGMSTVRTGTIFEETRLPMRVWLYALRNIEISGLRLSREMNITLKSSLLVLRRLRGGRRLNG